MKITIIDDLHPEDNAMLQALQSRSPASVEERLQKVRDAGSGNFMDKFYVGYGHKSIGDCGTTTIFIEGVSMLVAKAVQDWPLYSGQEASTRYMDFSEAKFADPLNSNASGMIQDVWRSTYLSIQDEIGGHLRQQYPRQEGEDEETYERAIKARGFDIARAFLPAGATTNLSWTTNLRQAQDHINWLQLHPDPQVRDVADAMMDKLVEKYPHSFEWLSEHSSYRNMVMEQSYFVKTDSIPFSRAVAADSMKHNVRVDCSGLQVEEITAVEWKILTERPRGMEVPWYFAELGQIRSTFPLDFGSYRDLQRHRNGVIRMPLLTTRMGFHPWYLEALSLKMRMEVEGVLREQKNAIIMMGCSPAMLQNYIAMGYLVPCIVTQSLPAFIYRMELRSGKSVHPTLRQMVHEEIRQFHPQRLPGIGITPEGIERSRITIHADMDPDSWTVRRGQQTITEKA